MTTACHTYTTERLSAFVDGELPPPEAAAVRAHAAACASCTAALADLRALVTTARSLDVPEPPPTLWPSIAGALDRRERLGWLSLSNWRPFAVGALAGAVAVVLVVFALPMLRARPEAPAAAAPPETAAVAPADPLLNEAEAEFAQAAAAYERSIAKLRTLLAHQETRWSPQERSRMAERMARLDDAIARSRELARRTPGDSAGNEQLFAAYQQKIAFLAAAVHRGGEAGEWDKPGARGP
jgi:negative regulator of sigma E activity